MIKSAQELLACGRFGAEKSGSEGGGAKEDGSNRRKNHFFYLVKMIKIWLKNYKN